MSHQITCTLSKVSAIKRFTVNLIFAICDIFPSAKASAMKGIHSRPDFCAYVAYSPHSIAMLPQAQACEITLVGLPFLKAFAILTITQDNNKILQSLFLAIYYLLSSISFSCLALSKCYFLSLYLMVVWKQLTSLMTFS